jgi:hypothetical protein
MNVVNLTDPQTWNMYAYVRDNPTTLTDPSGLQQATPNGGSSSNSYVDPDTMKNICPTSSGQNSPCGAGETSGSNNTTPAENHENSSVGVLEPPTDVAPPPPAPAPASPTTPPAVEPLPLGPLVFVATLVVGAAEQLITRTADAYVANQNDQAKYDATMSVVTVENAHKKGARPSTTQDHEQGEARKQRDRGGEAGDARRNKGGKPIVPRVRPDKHKGPWPPPGSSTY